MSLVRSDLGPEWPSTAGPLIVVTAPSGDPMGAAE